VAGVGSSRVEFVAGLAEGAPACDEDADRLVDQRRGLPDAGRFRIDGEV
jgi:hypothetical protein